MQTKIFKATVAAALSMAFAAVYAQTEDQDQNAPQGNGITVTIDGRPVHFHGTPPQMVNGRVLVPLRGVFERLGANVQWNPGQHEVIATRGHNNVELQIGNPSATVDGRQVNLDVPAQIVDGATMVPIRFVSESIGAEVKWREAEQMVVILSDRGRAQSMYVAPAATAVPEPMHRQGPAQEILSRNSVIPVVLDTPLSSDRSRPAERFTVTVRPEGGETYGFLPAGAKMTGEVVAAAPRRGGEPGMLQVQFTSMTLPDGNSYPITGTLIDLNDANIARQQGGMMIARGTAIQNVRRVFAGVGSEGRTVVVWGPNIERTNPRDVRLEAGATFGVRLLRDVTIRARDLRR